MAAGRPHEAGGRDQAAHVGLHRLHACRLGGGEIGADEVDAGNGNLMGWEQPTVAPTTAVPVGAQPAPVVHRSRNPVDRMTRRLPRPWRIAIDWIVTVAGAITQLVMRHTAPPQPEAHEAYRR